MFNFSSVSKREVLLRQSFNLSRDRTWKLLMPKEYQFCSAVSLALYRCVSFLLLPKNCYSLSLCPGGICSTRCLLEGTDF